MAKFLLSIAVAMTLSLSVRAGGLADKLPGTTAAYVEIDFQRILQQGEGILKGADPEHGGAIIADVKELWSLVQQLAEEYQFTPKLMESVGECHGYLVLLELPEVVEISRSVETIKYPETPEQWENFDPEQAPKIRETVTEEHTHCLSFVVEVPSPDIARDFFQQTQELIARLKAKDAENFKGKMVEVPVDDGAMFKMDSGPSTFGWVGRYLVVSDLQPKQLWHSLRADGEPASNLSRTVLMQRYGNGPFPAMMTAALNVESLLKVRARAEEKKLAEARAEAVKSGSEESADALQAAQRRKENYELLKAIVGLNNMKWVAGSLQSGTQGKTVNVLLRGGLLFGSEKLAPVMKHLLDGGARFNPPSFLPGDKALFMFRIGLEKMLQEVLASLPQEATAGYQMGSGMMKMQTGISPDEIAAALAGDVYVSMDFVKGKRQVFDSFDEESSEPKFKEIEAVNPQFTVLFGVTDREQFETLFSGVITKLTATGVPTASMIQKRTYQGSDVYLISTPMMDIQAAMQGNQPQDDGDPDAPGRFAIACTDRYMCIGKWRDITSVIRRSKAGAGEDTSALRDLAEKYRDANLLVWSPPDFNRRAQAMQLENTEQNMALFNDAVETMLSGLPTDNNVLGEKAHKTLKSLMGNMMQFNKRFITAPQKGQITVGKLSGNLYEIRQESQIVIGEE